MWAFLGLLTSVAALGCLVALAMGLVAPRQVVWWTSAKTRVHALAGYGGAFVALALCAGVVGGRAREADRHSDVPAVEASLAGSASLPDDFGLIVEVLKEDVEDSPMKTEVTQHLLVSGAITEPSLRGMLMSRYRAIRSRRGFRYHDFPTSVWLYAFTSREVATNVSQSVATLRKAHADVKATVDVGMGRYGQEMAPPVERFGLSDAARRNVFLEFVAAERRADADAEAKVPTPVPHGPVYSVASATRIVAKQAALTQELNRRYEAEVARKFGLTPEQLDEIAVEGVEKNWPRPARR